MKITVRVLIQRQTSEVCLNSVGGAWFCGAQVLRWQPY